MVILGTVHENLLPNCYPSNLKYPEMHENKREQWGLNLKTCLNIVKSTEN